jgi:hypothetical protein
VQVLTRQITEFRQIPEILTDIQNSPARSEIQTVVGVRLMEAMPNHEILSVSSYFQVSSPCCSRTSDPFVGTETRFSLAGCRGGCIGFERECIRRSSWCWTTASWPRIGSFNVAGRFQGSPRPSFLWTAAANFSTDSALTEKSAKWSKAAAFIAG